MKLQNFKPGGVTFRSDGWTCVEMHSSTCSHCQHITEFPTLRKMTDYIDFCRTCMEEICLQCVSKPCRTWLKKCDIDEAVSRNKLYGNLREV